MTLAVFAATAGRAQGTNWTRASVPPGTPGLYGVADSGGLFVTVGAEGVALTSADGNVWTTQLTGDPVVLNDVAWFPASAQFVAVGQAREVDGGGTMQATIRTSANGVDWVEVDPANLPTTANLNSVAAMGGFIVAVGADGVILTSENGADWVEQTSGEFAQLRGIGVQGSSTAYAVGDEGLILKITQEEGVFTFDAIENTPVRSILLDVAIVGNSTEGAPELVAVGENGVILTSSDGQTWSRQTSGTSSALFSVVSTGSRIIATGAFGTVRTSENIVSINNQQDEIVIAPIGEVWEGQQAGVSSWISEVIATGEAQLVAVSDSAAIVTSEPETIGRGTPVNLSVNSPVVVNATQSPPVLGLGARFSARVTVTNGDDEAFTDPYLLRILLTSIDSPNVQFVLGEMSPSEELLANNSAEFSFQNLQPVPLNINPGAYSLSAQISLIPPTDKEIVGVTISNQPVTVQGPDFSLSNANFPFGIIAEVSDDGQVVQFRDVTYDLRNTLAGNVAEGEAIPVRIFLSDDDVLNGGDRLIDQYSYTGGIEAGGTVTLPPSGADRNIVIPDSILGGNYFMIFEVNGGEGAIPESGSSPNALAQAVTISFFDLGVTPPNLPDIPQPPSGPKRLGTNTFLERVTLTLQNSGSVQYANQDPGDPLAVNLYLSSDNVVDTGDILLDRQDIDSLGPQSSRLVTFRRDGSADPVVPLSRELFIPDLPAGTYSLLAEIDFPEGVTDNNPAGNTSSLGVALDGPDLGLTDLIFSQGTVVTGSSVNGVFVTLRNTARGNVPENKPVSIEVFLSEDQSLDTGADTLLSSFIYSDGLAPGGHVQLPLVPDPDNPGTPPSLNLPEGVLGGDYFLLVSANRLGGVFESNSAANVIGGAITIETVDLAVTTPTLSANTVGVNTLLRRVATVAQNRGDLPYNDGYTVRIWLSQDEELDPSDRLLDEVTEDDPLAAVSSQTFVFEDVRIPPVSAGSYFVLAEVEPNDATEGSTNDDNVQAAGIEVGGPDIAVSGLSVPNPPTENELRASGASFVLRNEGIGAVLPVAAPGPGEEPQPGQEIFIQVFLSSQTGDSVVADPDTDPLLTTIRWTDGLAAGAGPRIELEAFNLPAGTANGDYSIVVAANLNNNVAEDADTAANNQTSVPVSVGTLDIVASAPIIAGEPAFVGTNTEIDQIDLSLTNQSSLTVNAGTIVTLYLSPASETTLQNGRPVSFNRSVVLGAPQSLPEFSQSRDVNFQNVTVPGNLVGGAYFLIAEAVLPGTQSDRVLSNNVAATSIAAELPDLQITQVVIPNDQVRLPENPQPGETVSIENVTFFVQNNQSGRIPEGTLIPITVGFADSDETVTIIGAVDLDGIPGNSGPVRRPDAPATASIEIPADLQGGTRILVFTINGGDDPVPESNLTNNSRNTQISLFTPERIDLAIDYGYFENTGGNGNWTSVQDEQASEGIAYQSPPPTDDQPNPSATFRTSIIGPTTMNVPWLILADQADVEVSVDPAPVPPLGSNQTRITGFEPNFRTNQLGLRNADTNESVVYEVEWTYNQNNDSRGSFARLDLDIPTFTTAGDGEWFGAVDDTVVVTNPITAEDGRQRSVRTPGDLAEGNQASFEVDVVGPALVSFFVRTDTHPDDTVSFLIDGEIQSLPTDSFDQSPEPAVFSGRDTPEEWRKVAFVLGSGERTLRWVFSKGSSDSSSVAYVDGLAVLKPVPHESRPNRNTPDPGFNAASVPPINIDLAIDEIIAAPGVYVLDDSDGSGRLPVTISAKNIGADFESAPDWDPGDLEIHLSLDQNFGNEDDIDIGDFAQVEVLANGNQVIFEADLNLPFNTPAGDYFLLVRFNPSFGSGEFTFANNAASAGPGFEIVRAPDLVIEQKRTFSDTYPYRPEFGSYILYDVANTGLGTVSPDQEFNLRLDLRGVRRNVPDLGESFLVKSYSEIPYSLFLPEVSGLYPNGGSAEIVHFVELPSLRDLLVAIGSIPPGTPEDDLSVLTRQDQLSLFSFYFQVTVDSSNDIRESSETNEFLISTPPQGNPDDLGQVFFSIVPVANFGLNFSGLPVFTRTENYGTYTGKEPFSNLTIREVNPLTDPDANTDGDGLNNLLEYALATNPTSATELFNRAQQNGTVRQNVPGFPDNSEFLTLTFDFNVRMVDLDLLVQASSSPIGPWETIVEIDPPYLQPNGEQSLTGFNGLISDPRVLSVEGNVTDIQSVYSARVTVRDIEPVGAGRFMRISPEPATTNRPPQPTSLGAGPSPFGAGVQLVWTIDLEAIGSQFDGAFQIERSTQQTQGYRLIGTTTDIDVNGDAQFVDTRLESNRTYFYRVRAVNVNGPSEYATSAQNPENQFVSILITN